jgi:hypothetical protein
MNDEYSTSDLGLSTFLLCSGCKLVALDRSDSSRVQFCFLREHGFDTLCQSYWSGTAKVNPMALLMSQKVLKQRLYDEK